MAYSANEYCDMYLAYGEARQNAREARRLYEQKFPQRALPSAPTFRALDIRLRETGCLPPKKINSGRPGSEANEEEILQEIEENPGVSTRQIAKNMHISHSTVWRMINGQGLYP